MGDRPIKTYDEVVRDLRANGIKQDPAQYKMVWKNAIK